MPILLGKNKKNNLWNDEPEKWYPYVKTRGTITEEQVARLVTEGTPLDMNLARMVISRLQEVMMEKILDGFTVMLGNWGYFYATINADASETKKEVTRDKVKRVRIHLRLNKEAEEALQKATFVFVEDLLTNSSREE